MTNATATPEDVRAARVRLGSAREALHGRPREQTLDALCELLDAFARPDGAARRKLAAELPDATGFHPATVRAGLDAALPLFTGDALREVVRREEGAAPNAQLLGFRQTSVLLAGAIPMPTLTALLFPLLLHSPVLAKTASRDAVTARVFAETLHGVDPELARCVEVVSFASGDAACTTALVDTDCVVATGSDETIRTISGLLPASTRFVGYGHRLSIALLGSQAFAGTSVETVADLLARDVALWDQQGCLSPVAIFCEAGAEEALAFGEAVGASLADLERGCPRGATGTEEKAAIRRERDEASMREARVFADEGTRFTVVVEDDLRWRSAPLARFVRIHRAKDRTALMDAIARVAPHLAGVAMGGFGAESPDVALALARLGASRICAPGVLQAPPLGWHHDGHLLLAPLARLSDLEGHGA